MKEPTVKQKEGTFLDDVTGFLSRNKYSILLISVLAGACIYYYIKSKEKKETNEEKEQPKAPPILHDDYELPDETSNYHQDNLSTSSMETIEIGENESKIVSIEDVKKEEEEVEEEKETYKRGPKKGQKKPVAKRKKKN